MKELESMYCDAQLARDNAKVIKFNNTLSIFHKVSEKFNVDFFIDGAVASGAEYGRVSQGKGSGAI